MLYGLGINPDISAVGNLPFADSPGEDVAKFVLMLRHDLTTGRRECILGSCEFQAASEAANALRMAAPSFAGREDVAA